MQKNVESRGLRLLALDGGGIRGLSELFILEEIMNRIKRVDRLDHVPRPCDYFDLIGGVGTGGLITLMIGKLQMPIKDVITAYVQLTQDVFSEKKLLRRHGSIFKATDLEGAIKKIIKAAKMHADIRMRDLPNTGCQSFVCAAPALNVSRPQLFRSYEVRANQTHNCTVWEAACATTAIPEFFKPILIGHPGLEEEFLSVGLGWNNPIALVLEEAEALFGSDKKLACIASIGTGHPETISWQSTGTIGELLSVDLIKVLRQVSHDCEDLAEQFGKRCRNTPDVYFRLSVEQGMQGVSFVDWEKLEEIKIHTSQYLSQPRISKMIDELVKSLCKCPSNVQIGDFGKPSIPAAKQHITSMFVVIPPPNAIFIGRDDVLLKMRECFFGLDSSQRQCRFVLHGLDGAGKTQIALKFIEQYRQQFSNVYFIDASTVSGLEIFFKYIAQEALIKDGTVRDGILWLSQIKKDWLLVFDNADDPQINLHDFFPSCNHGNIIITTRNSGYGTHAPEHRYEVGTINHAAAIELLCRMSGRENTSQTMEVMSKIVEELRHLTLAIVQAGAYLMQNPEFEFQKYLDSYKADKKIYHTQALEQSLDCYKIPIYKTWEISHSRLPKEAAEFLQVCAFLHHSGINEDVFQHAHAGLNDMSHEYKQEIQVTDGHCFELAAEFLSNFERNNHWDSWEFRRMIKALSSYSLIQVSGEDVYIIHPLVHEWARLHESQERGEKTHACAYQIIHCTAFYRSGISNYMQCVSLVPHANQVQDLQGLLYVGGAEVLGKMYFIGTRWKEAERMQIQVLDSKKERLGDTHSDTLKSMADLASTYMTQGRWTEAEQLQVQVLIARKKQLVEYHPDTLTSMSNLALTYDNQGKWIEAEQLQLQVLDATKKQLGEDHPDTLASMSNLTITYMTQGRWTEAEKLQLQVLDTTKKLFGKDHPDTLTSMSNLALAYDNQGKWIEAEQLQLQVLDATKKLFGENHPDTLISMANLAITYRDQGRWTEAEKLQFQVLDATKKQLREDHPNTLTSMSNLALTYGDQGKWIEAEQLQLQVLDATKKLFGEDHPDTLASMRNLTTTYMIQERWTEAEQLQHQVLDATKKLFGENHPDTLISMANLSITYRDQGRWTEAEQLQLQVLDATKKQLGEDHPNTLTSIANLAITYRDQGRWTEAGQLQLQVLDGTKKQLREDHPDTLISMANLAITRPHMQKHLNSIFSLDSNKGDRNGRPNASSLMGDSSKNTTDKLNVVANFSPQLSSQCVTPNLAFDHIYKKEQEVYNALVNLHYEGSYYIQAGFNEELMILGQYEEEIHVILENDVVDELFTIFSAIFHPFSGVICTPGTSYYIPTLVASPFQDLKHNLKSHSAGDSQASHSNESTQSTTSSGDANNNSGGNEASSGEEGKGKGVDRRGGGGEEGGRGSREPFDESNTFDGGQVNPKRGPRVITIPFRSTIGTKEAQDEPPIKFVIISGVEIEIQKNCYGNVKSTPPGSKWSGPWFSIDMKALEASTADVLPNKSPFTLSVAQVLITVSSCPNVAILNSAPTTMHLEDNTIKMKSEKTDTGGGQVSIGLNPSLRVSGSTSRVSGVEHSQRRWTIRKHWIDSCVGSGSGQVGGCKDGMLWKYTHHDDVKAFPPISGQNFGDVAIPNVVFGISKLEPLPLLEVEVVMHWSQGSVVRAGRFSRFLNTNVTTTGGGKKKSLSPPPAFTNFLHHVSVSVDLEKIEDGSSYVPAARSYDERTLEELTYFDPIKALVEIDGTLNSNCEISLRRAIQGRVEPLTAEERTSAMPLLLSGSAPLLSPNPVFPSTGLLTLTPSPSPPSLPEANSN